MEQGFGRLSLATHRLILVNSTRNIFFATLVFSILSLGLLNSSWLNQEVMYALSNHNNSLSLPPTSYNKSSEAIIKVPKIHVRAPIVVNEQQTDARSVSQALRSGVLLYGNSSKPGLNGNTVIVGHSSGMPLAPGKYKWVFTLLDKLKTGDKIVLSYQGLNYVYTVQSKTVVSPNNSAVLQPTKSSTLSLITCTPVGTNKNRLVVRAGLDKNSQELAQKKSLPTNKHAIEGSVDRGRVLISLLKSTYN
jgi:LPXTG-site transpeptidase (sortase) family protein